MHMEICDGGGQQLWKYDDGGVFFYCAYRLLSIWAPFRLSGGKPIGPTQGSWWEFPIPWGKTSLHERRHLGKAEIISFLGIRHSKCYLCNIWGMLQLWQRAGSAAIRGLADHSPKSPDLAK